MTLDIDFCCYPPDVYSPKGGCGLHVLLEPSYKRL